MRASCLSLLLLGLALSACGNDQQAGEVADWWYDGTPRGNVDSADAIPGTVVADPLGGNENSIFSGQRR